MNRCTLTDPREIQSWSILMRTSTIRTVKQSLCETLDKKQKNIKVVVERRNRKEKVDEKE